MFTKRLKKTLSAILSASLVLGLCIVPGKVFAAPETDITGWQSSISIDFGTHTSECDTATRMQDVEGFSDVTDSLAALVAGYGNMTYSNTSVADLYETATGATEQHIGFDRVIPAGKATAGGNYFTDWVFSPDGEAYTFSADLPVGQYYVYVYTGNKTKDYSNTTFVNFNNEAIGEDSILYDQTSLGGSQFYGPTQTECVYTVDVIDNGNGYGTLSVNLSDTSINDEAYADSHKLTIGAELAAEAPASIDHFDFYTDTEDAIDSETISDKLVTARLNGIEIVPVKTPVHMNSFTAGSELSVEVGTTGSFAAAIEGAESTTDRIVYKSLNPDIASIDVYSGTFTANKIGEATLLAYNTALKQSVNTKLSVTEETYVSLDKTSATVVLDDTNEASLDIIATLNLAENDVVTWTSDKTNIVTVESSEFKSGNEKSTSTAKLKIKDVGTAVITATRTDSNKSAVCEITVTRAVKGVSLCDSDGKEYADDTKLTVQAGETIKLSAIITPDNATNKDVSYSVSDKSIASVSAANGIATIKGISAGEVIITVVSDDNADIKDTITITVTPAPAIDSPSPDPNESQVNPPAQTTDTPNATPAPTYNESSKLYVTKAKTINLKVKKSVTYKAKATGTAIKKLTVKCKASKKLVKIKKSGKKVKVTALKKGTVKLVFKLKGADGTSVKVTKKIKIK